MARYGECPECRQAWALNKAGTMRRHNPGDGVDCPGVGREPVVTGESPRGLYLKMCEFIGPRPRWHVIVAARTA
jgi:hypothetical protein